MLKYICPAPLNREIEKSRRSTDGLRAKVFEHMEGVVPIMGTIGEIATVIGFVSLIVVKVLTVFTTSQLCGVRIN